METKQEYIVFLNEALAESEKLAEMETKTAQQDILHKKLAKSLKSETKAMEDSIDITIKKRKNELEKSFDEELEKADSILRKAKNQREKAKTKGQNARISEETLELRDEIRRHKIEIKTMFKKDKVPGYCDSRLFFALTSPKGVGDFLIILLCFAICFLAVPIGLYMLIGDGQSMRLVLIYLGAIIIFGGLYVLLFIRAKTAHGQTLEQVRKIRSVISAQEKQVDAITKSIRDDKNEEMYGLGSYDENISDIQEEKNRIAERRNAALEQFENEVKPRITQEIRQNHSERLGQLETEMKEAGSVYEDMEAVLQDQKLNVAQKFETVLGRDYKKEEITALIAYLESGKAANISEAQSLYRMGAKTNGEEEI